eukprot:1048007_1
MRKRGDTNVTEVIPTQIINIPRAKVESIMRKHMGGEKSSDSVVVDIFSSDKSGSSPISGQKKWCTVDQLLQRDAGEWIVTGHHSDPQQMDHQKTQNYDQDRGSLKKLEKENLLHMEKEPHAWFQNYVN